MGQVKGAAACNAFDYHIVPCMMLVACTNPSSHLIDDPELVDILPEVV